MAQGCRVTKIITLFAVSLGKSLSIVIISGVNCSTPPEKPESGTWEWDGGFEYDNKIKYTCGPYGQFCPEGKALVIYHYLYIEYKKILKTYLFRFD